MAKTTVAQPGVSPLVRQYSLDAEKEEPNNQLIQAVNSTIRQQDEIQRRDQCQTQEWSEWLKFGNSSDDADLRQLEESRKKIVEIWQQFRQDHNETAQEGSSLYFSDVPSITTLRKIVSDAQVKWQNQKGTGFGKIKNYVSEFLGMMDDHSYFFDVIPTGDKYISLITGVVSSVVKISSNYRQVTEGFFSALVDISSDLRLVEKKANIWDSPDLRKLVVDYYVKVFDFLCHALSWFSRRHRIRKALHKDAYNKNVKDMSDNEIKSKLDDIWKITTQPILCLQIVGSESRNDSPLVIEAKRDKLGQLVGNFSIRTLQEVENHVEYDLQSHKMHAKEEKQNILRVLDADGLQSESDSGTFYRLFPLTGFDMVKLSPDEAVEDVDDTCTRYDIQKATASLMKYTEDGRQELANALRGHPNSLLPHEVLNEIQSWIRSPESRMIWIEGISSSTYGSNISLVALQLCAISLRAQIPCVSFFCKPRYSFPLTSHTNMSNAEASTVALLYSVIAQLARLIPADFQGALGLEKRIQLLDGSFTSAATALQVIRDLLVHIPPSTIWVIDGLQLAESRGTIHILDEFVAMLRKQEQLQVSKACFTTDGNSHVLLPAIRVHERVDASRMALARPGLQLGGSGDVITELSSW